MLVNDHLQNFPYSNLPAFCVGLADSYEAPSPGGGRFMRIPARTLRGEPAWAMALLEAGLDAGFDFAYSYEIESWDELSVPLHFLTPAGRLRRTPNAVVRLEGLRAAYAADPLLPQLVASARSIVPPQSP